MSQQRELGGGIPCQRVEVLADHLVLGCRSSWDQWWGLYYPWGIRQGCHCCRVKKLSALSSFHEGNIEWFLLMQV